MTALLHLVGPPPDGIPMQKQLTHSLNSEEKNSSGSRHRSGAGGDDGWKHPGPEYPGCNGRIIRSVISCTFASLDSCSP